MWLEAGASEVLVGDGGLQSLVQRGLQVGKSSGELARLYVDQAQAGVEQLLLMGRRARARVCESTVRDQRLLVQENGLTYGCCWPIGRALKSSRDAEVLGLVLVLVSV